MNKKTGELINSNEIRPLVDFDKVEEYKKSMGFYQIVSSELTMDALEVIDKYHGLTQIEDQFRVMKSDLETRPVFVRTDIPVNAHFLLCYVTLVIMRVIEHMLKEEFTTKELREALCRYSCSYLDQNYYLFDYRDKVIDAIGEKYGWDLSKKYMSQAEIKNILKHKPKNRFSNNSLQR